MQLPDILRAPCLFPERGNAAVLHGNIEPPGSSGHAVEDRAGNHCALWLCTIWLILRKKGVEFSGGFTILGLARDQGGQLGRLRNSFRGRRIMGVHRGRIAGMRVRFPPPPVRPVAPAGNKCAATVTTKAGYSHCTGKNTCLFVQKTVKDFSYTGRHN